MKKLFRKTRVVHIPEDCIYEVHCKKGFFYPWTYQCRFEYYIGDRKTYFMRNQEEAKSCAIKRAEELTGKSIVWESK